MVWLDGGSSPPISTGRLMAAFLFTEYSSTLNSQLFAQNTPFRAPNFCNTPNFSYEIPLSCAKLPLLPKLFA